MTDPEKVNAELRAEDAGWREKGIEYKSPEYWAELQDRAGKK
jgi:hypothetical protein